MKQMSVDSDQDNTRPSSTEDKPHPSGPEKVCPFMGGVPLLGTSASYPPRDRNTSYSEELLEMEQFALQAAENAKQAAQLADWAASMVQRLKRCGKGGTPVGGIGHVAPCGTPVDPSPVVDHVGNSQNKCKFM